jgi:hypothetical protein
VNDTAPAGPASVVVGAAGNVDINTTGGLGAETLNFNGHQVYPGSGGGAAYPLVVDNGAGQILTVQFNNDDLVWEFRENPGATFKFSDIEAIDEIRCGSFVGPVGGQLNLDSDVGVWANAALTVTGNSVRIQDVDNTIWATQVVNGDGELAITTSGGVGSKLLYNGNQVYPATGGGGAAYPLTLDSGTSVLTLQHSGSAWAFTNSTALPYTMGTGLTVTGTSAATRVTAAVAGQPVYVGDATAYSGTVEITPPAAATDPILKAGGAKALVLSSGDAVLGVAVDVPLTMRANSFKLQNSGNTLWCTGLVNALGELALTTSGGAASKLLYNGNQVYPATGGGGGITVVSSTTVTNIAITGAVAETWATGFSLTKYSDDTVELLLNEFSRTATAAWSIGMISSPIPLAYQPTNYSFVIPGYSGVGTIIKSPVNMMISFANFIVEPSTAANGWAIGDNCGWARTVIRYRLS